ncbi:unnamed protein product [Sphagnum tenellum]
MLLSCLIDRDHLSRVWGKITGNFDAHAVHSSHYASLTKAKLLEHALEAGLVEDAEEYSNLFEANDEYDAEDDEETRKRKRAARYAAKDAEKPIPEEFSDCGRFWGCSRSLLHPVIILEDVKPHVFNQLYEDWNMKRATSGHVNVVSLLCRPSSEGPFAHSCSARDSAAEHGCAQLASHKRVK